MVNKRRVRCLLALGCIVTVCVSVGVTVIALKSSQTPGPPKNDIVQSPLLMPIQSPSSTPSTTPSTTPSSITSSITSSTPSLIDAHIEVFAASISGFTIVLTEGSPQHRAVGWLSTWDKFDTQGIEQFFLQRYFMTVFYFAMNGEQWLEQEKWLSPSLHICDWSFGFICNTDQTSQQIVTGIDLPRNGISGNIPNEISLMEGLTTLRLAKNAVNGTIPTTLSQLKTLTLIDLSTNELTGTIPSGIGNLKDLLILDLYQNLLTGSIPPSTYNLSLLKKLDLANNKFTGFLSQNLTYLDSLSTLNLRYNQFKGQVPEFTGLNKLELIYLDDNDFTGTLSNLGRDLVGLTELTISHNHISGGFFEIESINASEFFENNHKTQRVEFSFNQMTGTIPELIARISTIRYMIYQTTNLLAFSQLN